MKQLLCIFTDTTDFDTQISDIKLRYEIVGKIFILRLSDTNTYAITFNSIKGISLDGVMLHRKQSTNTLYTLNAMNQLIRNLNQGKLDTSFKLNWNNYQNSLLTTSNGIVKIYQTELIKIIN